MKTITRLGIGLVVLTMALGLPSSQPAYADDDAEITQAEFVDDCNDDGAVSVPAGTELEVLNPDGDLGVITTDCTVTLTADGDDTELNLGENTNLLFCGSGDPGPPATCEEGDYKDLTITGAGDGAEIEVQVKKNSSIEARNLTVTLGGGDTDEAEAQFEDNFCLRLHSVDDEGGHLSMTVGSPGEGGDVQLKKFEERDPVFTFTDDTECGTSPNIIVDGSIFIEVSGKDSEIQIEEFNHISAGGDITLTGASDETQIQTKQEVTLEAEGVAPLTDGDITLSALGDKGEVQAEDMSTYTAENDITLETGADGKTEVKKESVFTAGGLISITTGAGGECKVEDPGTLGADCS